MNETPLFSWLHISDLHISGQQIEIQISQLIADLSLLKDGWYVNEYGERYGPPVPQVVFVTGDLANKGDASGLGEYTGATNYLTKICGACNIDKKNVFLVPGNHDINCRALDKKQLDLLLDNPEDYDQLTIKRFNNYLIFAKKFARVDFFVRGLSYLSWHKEFDRNVDINITIVGLNTALTSATKLINDNPIADDLGSLKLDKRIIETLKSGNILDKDKINIILMHHPESFLNNFLSLKNAIILHGHTHQPNIMRISSPKGSNILTIAAGALRLGVKTDSSFEQHGYNISAIYRDDEAYRIDVWPRVFFETEKDSSRGQYYLDAVNVDPGKCYTRISWHRENSPDRPRMQHGLFWEIALRSLVKKSKIEIWIAAHSAWYTFRPKTENSNWDNILFHNTAQLKLENLEGDVWKPLIQLIQSNNNIKIEFFILLAHPYGVEAQCVLRNQLIYEKNRNAKKDFFRTLRSLQLIHKLDDIKNKINFDIRVLNPCFRIMTHSIYAVGEHILFVPLQYSILVDKGFAVGQTKDSRYGKLLEKIKEYFTNSNHIKDSNNKLYLGARKINLEHLPINNDLIDDFIHATINDKNFSWLHPNAVYEETEDKMQEKADGSFHKNWMVKTS